MRSPTPTGIGTENLHLVNKTRLVRTISSENPKTLLPTILKISLCIPLSVGDLPTAKSAFSRLTRASFFDIIIMYKWRSEMGHINYRCDRKNTFYRVADTDSLFTAAEEIVEGDNAT